MAARQLAEIAFDADRLILRKLETCFDEKRIHNSRDVSQAFETRARRLIPALVSFRFIGRSDLLRPSSAASGATLDQTSLLDGAFPEGIYL